jgi:hypothetical protein
VQGPVENLQEVAQIRLSFFKTLWVISGHSRRQNQCSLRCHKRAHAHMAWALDPRNLELAAARSVEPRGQSSYFTHARRRGEPTLPGVAAPHSRGGLAVSSEQTFDYQRSCRR